MRRLWALGLLRRRGGRLLAASLGISIAVSLLGGLGCFLVASKATMTRRASSGVAVDWQVEVHPNAAGGPEQVLRAVRRSAGTVYAVPVLFAHTPGLQATTHGTTQVTGAGRVLGLPRSYARSFPQSMRLLAGSMAGPLVAQQTAANLHVRPGDTVTVRRAGSGSFTVRLAGVVELPQADSLFQRVGAPPQSQLIAPPDNVVLLPTATFRAAYRSPSTAQASAVTVQIHARRSHALAPDPALAFVQDAREARNLEATTAGAGVVGDNLGAVLDAAREDASYAQVLFLFLAAPGAVLGAALTAAVVEAGGARRRAEQSLLRARGCATGRLFQIVLVEAGLVAGLGGVIGLLVAAVVGLLAFGTPGFGATPAASLVWGGLSFAAGLLIAICVIVFPARRELSRPRQAQGPTRPPAVLSYGADVVLIAVSAGILWAAGRNKYSLVLAPEGVPTLTVSYWAFLAPALGWIGAGLLAWRFSDLLLGRGRAVLRQALRPLARNLAPTVAAMMSGQRRTIARSAVLVGLALSFAMSTATFNATYRQQAEVDAQLSNGADVTVNASPGTFTPPSYADALAKLPGVRAVQPMEHRFAYVGNDLQDLYGVDPRTIVRATTLQNAYFQGGTATEMLHRLAARPDAALVSAETVNDFQLTPGTPLRLRLQDTRTQAYTPVTFHYVGIVNEFPTAPKDSFIVANAQYVAAQTHSPTVGTFLVDAGGSHTRQVAAEVRRKVGTSATVTTINGARGLVQSSLTSVDLSGLTRLELGYSLVIAVAAGGLVLALGMNERRQSIAVAAALGATRRQLRRLQGGEAMFVALVGLLTGALTGWAMSYLLVKVLTGVFDPPPASLAFPWTYLTLVGTCMVVSIIAAAALMSAWASKNAREYLREL